MSDLHVDVNSEHDISWEDKDQLTIIAGDIAGIDRDNRYFLRQKLHNVVFIAGNHIVYNYQKQPIQTLYKNLSQEFPISSNISFLQDSYKIIGDAVFIGSCLWTDYSYDSGIVAKGTPRDRLIDFNMQIAQESMNDYNWGLWFDGKENVKLMPAHCAEMFKKSLSFAKETYDKFSDSGKKIVWVVHHGISPKVLGLGYTYDEIACCYITDLEKYIAENMPNLALIVHGHIHISCAYKIANIPVICNARGYIDYPKPNKNFDKDLVVEI
jgi:predicted phosphodiesterase